MKLFGIGEMADSDPAAFDWSQTSDMARIDSMARGIAGYCKYPVELAPPQVPFWWGEDLVQFYNDAYRPSLGVGKHPMALGAEG